MTGYDGYTDFFGGLNMTVIAVIGVTAALPPAKNYGKMKKMNHKGVNTMHFADTESLSQEELYRFVLRITGAMLFWEIRQSVKLKNRKDGTVVLQPSCLLAVSADELKQRETDWYSAAPDEDGLCTFTLKLAEEGTITPFAHRLYADLQKLMPEKGIRLLDMGLWYDELLSACTGEGSQAPALRIAYLAL